MPDEEDGPRPLRVNNKHYSVKEGENFTLWIREIEMDIRSGLILSISESRSPSLSSMEELRHHYLGISKSRSPSLS